MLPLFKRKTSITVKVLAVGTGQRSTLVGAAILMLCSCMPNRRN